MAYFSSEAFMGAKQYWRFIGGTLFLYFCLHHSIHMNSATHQTCYRYNTGLWSSTFPFMY